MECNLYSKLYKLDTVSLRYFNVYSPDQQANSTYATAISNFMQHIRENKSPFITGNGQQRRDMAHVEDIVSANIFAMEYNDRFNGKNYDVGTGDNISLNEIKKIVLKYFPDVEFEYVKDRLGEVLQTKANTAPLSNLGWKAKVDIINGIEDCFDKLKKELK